MNKEELTKAMREAAQTFRAQNKRLPQIYELIPMCAEAALTLMSREWVRVEDAKLHHRQPLWLKAKEFNYAIHGYYNEIIGVFHAYGNPEFDGHRHTVTDIIPINLPTPPKQ